MACTESAGWVVTEGGKLSLTSLQQPPGKKNLSLQQQDSPSLGLPSDPGMTAGPRIPADVDKHSCFLHLLEEVLVAEPLGRRR